MPYVWFSFHKKGFWRNTTSIWLYDKYKISSMCAGYNYTIISYLLCFGNFAGMLAVKMNTRSKWFQHSVASNFFFLVFIIINRSKKSGTKSCRLKSIKLTKVKKNSTTKRLCSIIFTVYHGNLTLISFFNTRPKLKLFCPEIHNLLPLQKFFFFYLHVHSTKNARTYSFFFKFPCYSCQVSRQSTQLKLFFFQLELPSLCLWCFSSLTLCSFSLHCVLLVSRLGTLKSFYWFKFRIEFCYPCGNFFFSRWQQV